MRRKPVFEWWNMPRCPTKRFASTFLVRTLLRVLVNLHKLSLPYPRTLPDNQNQATGFFFQLKGIDSRCLCTTEFSLVLFALLFIPS